MYVVSGTASYSIFFAFCVDYKLCICPLAWLCWDRFLQEFPWWKFSFARAKQGNTSSDTIFASVVLLLDIRKFIWKFTSIYRFERPFYYFVHHFNDVILHNFSNFVNRITCTSLLRIRRCHEMSRNARCHATLPALEKRCVTSPKADAKETIGL